MTKELVGYCGVDAGIIWIGDPCYIYHHPEMFCNGQKIKDGDKEIQLPDKWGEFCSDLEDLPKEYCSGVISQSGWGDGEYPVYATIDEDGRVSKLEIDFSIPDEDE